MKNNIFLLLAFIVLSMFNAQGQAVALDSIFKAYGNEGNCLSFNMSYRIKSIPDSFMKKEVKGKMAVVSSKKTYRYTENGIEYVLVDGYSMKINHNKKYIDLLNSKPQNNQFDFQELKSTFQKWNVKVGLISKNNNETIYYFKFPNADSNSCIMIQETKTGFIKEYKFNMWAQNYDGEYYLKSYLVKYSDYKLVPENYIEPRDYILISNNEVLSYGKCLGYQVNNKAKSTKENVKN